MKGDYYDQTQKLLEWVKEVEQLCQPIRFTGVTVRRKKNATLLKEMVDSGAATPLDPVKRPNCYLFRSDPSDVARVEDRTYIASKTQDQAGLTNNWIDPVELKKTMTDLFKGCMKGRTLYVIPFSMGPIGSRISKIGVELTDSPYVVANMRIMTRMGKAVLDILGEDGEFVPCLHSIGAPLEKGQQDVAWPCAPIEKSTSATFPRKGLFGRSARAMAAMRCLVKSVLRCVSPRCRPETKAACGAYADTAFDRS